MRPNAFVLSDEQGWGQAPRLSIVTVNLNLEHRFDYRIRAELRWRLWLIECILRCTHRGQCIRNVAEQSLLSLAKCTSQLCVSTLCTNRTAFVSPLPHCHLCGYGSSSGPTEGLSFCWPSPPPQQLSYEWVNCKTDLSKTSCSPTNVWSHRKSGPTTAIIANNSIESGDGITYCIE